MRLRRRIKCQGLSLVELLCCIVIIAILVGLLLGPVTKAYKRARGLVTDINGG
jgi:prepilin-type N-terminal cleavage/methylation domain-containing protein